MSLEQIRQEALELKKLRDEKDSLNERLKEINEGIRNLEEFTLNASLEEAGISDVTLNGVHIKKGVVFRGGYTKSNDKETFQYLFDTDNEGALKQQIVIDLAKHSELPVILKNNGIEYEIVYSIHHMTLSSILKDLVAEGKLSTEDFDKYHVYAQPQIKVEMKE